MMYIYRCVIIIFLLLGITSLTFATDNQDAKPIRRTPPTMPKLAAHSGHCKLVFDVSEKGKTENIRVTTCTEYLFAEHARQSIETWIYSPKIEGGIPVLRRDVKTKITFKLSKKGGALLPEPNLIQDNVEIKAQLKTKFKNPYQLMTRLPKADYCCMTYSVSQIGRPFNTDTLTCSNFEVVIASERFLRSLYFHPVTNGREMVSVGKQKMIIQFVDVDKIATQDTGMMFPVIGNNNAEQAFCADGF